MLTYLSSYLAMASALYYVVFEGAMSIIDPKFHDYFIPHSFDVSGSPCQAVPGRAFIVRAGLLLRQPCPTTRARQQPWRLAEGWGLTGCAQPHCMT